MDVVGAYEIFCRLPDAQIKFAAEETGIIETEYPSMKMAAIHRLA